MQMKKAIAVIRSKNKGYIPGLEFVSKFAIQHAMNPNTDLPQAYDVVSEAPKVGSLDWVNQKVMGIDRAILDQFPTIGGIAGGTGAAALTAESGPGVVPARMAGAGFGGGGGEKARQEIESMLVPYEYRPTPEENNMGIKIEAGTMAGAEGLGLAGVRVLKPLQKYFADTALVSEQAGFRMLPSEAHGTIPNVFESYPKGSIFTASKMAAWRKLQNEETERAARNLADSISKRSLSKTGSMEEAGNIIRNGIEHHMEAFRRTQEAVYNKIANMANAAGVKVSRKGMVNIAKQELKKINIVRNQVGGVGPTDEFKNELESIIANSNADASYAAMKDYRTYLLEKVRNMNSLMSSPEKKILVDLANTVGDAIEDGLKNSKVPQLADMWRSANNVTHEEHKVFLEKLVENLAAKKNPEAIALILRGNSPGAIAQIGIKETRDVMSVIPKQMIPRVQKQILLDTIYESSGKGTETFNEKMFAKKMLQIGDERGEVLFGNNWANIKQFSELLNRISESGGLTAAGLANPGLLNQMGRLSAEAVATFAGVHAAHGPGLMAAAVPIMGEAALWKTVAAAMTHPEAAARILQIMQVLARTVPYASAAATNAGRGEKIGKGDGPDEKRLNDVKQKAHDLQDMFHKSGLAPAPTPAEGTGPQSRNQTHTHIWDEKQGKIVPV
jgi:hypothetical protein